MLHHFDVFVGSSSAWRLLRLQIITYAATAAIRETPPISFALWRLAKAIELRLYLEKRDSFGEETVPVFLGEADLLADFLREAESDADFLREAELDAVFLRGVVIATLLLLKSKVETFSWSLDHR